MLNRTEVVVEEQSLEQKNQKMIVPTQPLVESLDENERLIPATESPEHKEDPTHEVALDVSEQKLPINISKMIEDKENQKIESCCSRSRGKKCKCCFGISAAVSPAALLLTILWVISTDKPLENDNKKVVIPLLIVESLATIAFCITYSFIKSSSPMNCLKKVASFPRVKQFFNNTIHLSDLTNKDKQQVLKETKSLGIQVNPNDLLTSIEKQISTYEQNVGKMLNSIGIFGDLATGTKYPLYEIIAEYADTESNILNHKKAIGFHK